MPIAADYPLMDVFWTMIIFFAWMSWFWILIKVVADVFRRDDASGWKKAAWVMFVIVLPFLGVFIYLIANGGEMAHRDVETVQANQARFDDHVRAVSGGNGAAEQIEKGARLRDSGAITEAEFGAIKRQALA